MADPKIKVEIEAEIKGLQSGVDQAEKELSQLGKAADAVSPKIDKATKSASNFNSVGTDFARIIQDAPFGIIGVSNNITQLASSFGAARAQGKSFTSILGGIFSGGNLLTIGISALTSAFVILEQQGFFKTQKAAESLGDALDEYRGKLDAVTRASIEGQGNSQREIQSFNLLRAQAENANIPLATRLEAVRDLKKEYPEYLNGLSNEQILTGKVGGAYDELTKSITATAKARAFSDQIAKNSLDLLTLEQQAQERVNTLLEKQTKLAPLLAAQANQATKSRGEITGLDLQVLDLQKEIRDLQFEQVSNIESANKLKAQSEALEAKITTEISNGAKFTNQSNDARKESIKLEDELLARIQLGNELRKDAGGKLEKLAPQLLDQTITQKVDIQLSGTPVEDAVSKADQKVIDGLSNTRSKLLNFNKEATDILNQGISMGLGDVAFAIGEALATGGNVIESAGAVMLGAFATVLNQLGQLAIGTGVAMESIKAAFKSLGGGGAIAAGVALIALAGAVSSKAKKIGGGLNRGSAGSFSGASGVSAGTSFAGAGQGLQFDRSLNLVGEFRVKGQDLVYVFNEASSRNQRG
jgi:hypothetical protein